MNDAEFVEFVLSNGGLDQQQEGAAVGIEEIPENFPPPIPIVPNPEEVQEEPNIYVAAYNSEDVGDPVELAVGVEDSPAVVSQLNDGLHFWSLVRDNPIPLNIKLRAQAVGVGSWWNLLNRWADFEHIVAMIDSTPLGILARIPFLNNEPQCTKAIVERWSPETHTFHFPFAEMGITPLDFTMLTGIPVGSGRRVPFAKDYETSHHYAAFLPHCYHTVLGGWVDKKVKLTALKEAYELPLHDPVSRALLVERIPPGSAAATEYVRAFLLFMMGKVIFPSNKNLVSLGWVAMMENGFPGLHQYDFGGMMMYQMYRGLDTCSLWLSTAKQCNCLWFSPIVDYWFYCYFGVLGPCIRNPQDWRPRIGGMVSGASRFIGSIRNHYDMTRTQMEQMTQRSIHWRPWFRSAHLAAADVQRALQLSRARVVLRGYRLEDQCWYLGDRCFRQLTGRISIPWDVPPTMDVRRGADIPPHVVDQSYVDMSWADSEGHTAHVTEEQYTRYWSRVSIGRLLTDAMHVGNVELYGPRALRPGVELGQPSQPVPDRHPVAAYVPPPIPEEGPASFQVWTSQAQTQTLPVPYVPPERFAELHPHFDDYRPDQIRDLSIQTTLTAEGLRLGAYQYTSTFAHDFVDLQERFGSLQLHHHHLQAEFDAYRASVTNAAASGGSSRRRVRQRHAEDSDDIYVDEPSDDNYSTSRTTGSRSGRSRSGGHRRNT
ncbi:hypothetical protein ACHQM5_023355 [Ranunculus cassubicifolius]